MRSQEGGGEQVRTRRGFFGVCGNSGCALMCTFPHGATLYKNAFPWFEATPSIKACTLLGLAMASSLARLDLQASRSGPSLGPPEVPLGENVCGIMESVTSCVKGTDRTLLQRSRRRMGGSTRVGNGVRHPEHSGSPWGRCWERDGHRRPCLARMVLKPPFWF